ncbi:MAG: hypothetical protein PHF86_12770 [Candidatus Nanoarchaeia archaeon]|nr:hypothetical protein [Candidatus Nanoarchaeia archaeon]
MKSTLEDKLPKKIKDFTNSQISAMKHAIELGKLLQKTIPQIAKDYREGISLKEIVKNYNLSSINNLSEDTASEAVRYALCGYHSNIRFLSKEVYDGLIPLDEYLILSEKHHSDNARKVDEQMRRENQGLYGISTSQRILNGKKGARTQIKEKIGIHGKSHEEHQQIGKSGAEAAGYTVWSNDEKLSVLNMVTQPKYRRSSMIASAKIANELNNLYHQGESIRTAVSISRFLSDYKHGLRQ